MRFLFLFGIFLASIFYLVFCTNHCYKNYDTVNTNKTFSNSSLPKPPHHNQHSKPPSNSTSTTPQPPSATAKIFHSPSALSKTARRPTRRRLDAPLRGVKRSLNVRTEHAVWSFAPVPARGGGGGEIRVRNAQRSMNGRGSDITARRRRRRRR